MSNLRSFCPPIFLLSLFSFLVPHCSVAQNTNLFTITPASSTNLVGSTVQLRLLENGGPVFEIFEYQWVHDGISLLDGGNISGAQTSILTITDAQLTDGGTYSVILSAAGVVQATASALVFVIDQPVLQDVTAVSSGAGVTFTAIATGGLLSYQWLWQGEPLAGASTSALRFINPYAAASAGYYTVVVSNQLGSVTSAPPGRLFTKPVPTGTYQGIFFDDTDLQPDSTGFFQYTLSSTTRSFSGRVTIGPKTYPFSGRFSLAHDAQLTISRAGNSPLTLQLQLITLNDTPQVIGSVSDGNWSASLGGHRLFFNGRNPTPLAGKYTLAFQNTNTLPSTPNGDGLATLVIRKDGTVVMSGQAPDGIKLAQTCGLSRLGDWPLYASMLNGRGRLVGWFQVRKQAGSSIRGTNVFCFKKEGPDKLYPEGYSLLLLPAGSTFTPATTNSLLGFTNGIAAFSAGDLFLGEAPAWDFVRVFHRRPCSFIAEPAMENLQLFAQCGNGLLSGQFVDFATGLRTPIKGVVLQQQNFASGFFLSTNASGHFALSPAQ